MSEIRVKSICVFRQGDKVLLSQMYDPGKDQSFLIPIGGGVNFYETAMDAARRETLEELGAVADSFQLLGILENMFEFDGVPGHEIVFVYEARFINSDLYHQTELQGTESNGLRFLARWFTREELAVSTLPVFPTGVIELMFCEKGS